MKWYSYVLVFVGGAFVANFVPHIVHGISGEMFTTPFASPPGRGLSPPWVNVLWGLGNLALGYVALRVGKFSISNITTALVAFAGFAFLAIQLSFVFGALPK